MHSLVRKALESLYTGVCTITGYQEVRDPETCITSQQEVMLLQEHPCRISVETVVSANPSETVSTIRQSVKLFLSPETAIPPGSKVTVRQNGITTSYQSSGSPAVYPDHQEIVLELWKERA